MTHQTYKIMIKIFGPLAFEGSVLLKKNPDQNDPKVWYIFVEPKLKKKNILKAYSIPYLNLKLKAFPSFYDLIID